MTSSYDYSSYGNPRDQGWGSNNLISITSPSGVKFTVNKQAASAFTGFLGELENSGYQIDQKDSGGYNLRNITGGSTLSPHAYGIAVDVNWNKNPYSKNAQGGTLTTDLPANVGDIAAKYGLDWGGNWKSLKDPMHFEYHPAAGTQVASAAPQATTTAPANQTQAQTTGANTLASWITPELQARLANLGNNQQQTAGQSDQSQQQLALYRQLLQKTPTTTQQQPVQAYQTPMLPIQTMQIPAVAVSSNPIRSRNYTNV